MNNESIKKIIDHFYPAETPLKQLLLRHSEQVREKALEIAKLSGMEIDVQIVSAGSMLHDIGILYCHAPKIFCTGTEHYLRHGLIGAQMLRELDPALEVYARICERHTGSGLTAGEIRLRQLPLPEQDFLPETKEEKLICLADKFFSKSGDLKEKCLENIRRSMVKFGTEPLARFDALCKEFKLIS